MVKRNSFTKFMLIVCGIVLMATAFSGCTDADAPAPQTQLSDAPSGNNNSAIQTAGGESLDDLFDLARDDPEGFLDKDIEKYKLTGLGEAPGGSGVIENSKYDLAWKNPFPGIKLYKEEYNSEGKLKLIKLIKKRGTGISIYDATKNNNEIGQDGNIDMILNLGS